MRNTPIIFQLNQNQQDCVHALEQALELAREGKIDGLAVVACLKDGYAPVIVGNRPGDLMLGVFRIMRMIDDATNHSPKTNAVSRLVRARTT